MANSNLKWLLIIVAIVLVSSIGYKYIAPQQVSGVGYCAVGQSTSGSFDVEADTCLFGRANSLAQNGVTVDVSMGDKLDLQCVCSHSCTMSIDGADVRSWPETPRIAPYSHTVSKAMTEVSCSASYGEASVKTDMYFRVGGLCNTEADTNCDTALTKLELLTYLDSYISGAISKQKILNALQAWLDGGAL